jgi:II/X family phage/plasmid replication protein
VYWGKHSRRWSLKAYSKGKELIDHKLPHDLPDRERFSQWASGILRIEACYRSLELKRRNLDRFKNLTETKIADLWTTAVAALNLGITQTVTAELETVSRAARSTAYQWQSGIDMQGILPRATWYRHRAELLGVGIDIAVPVSAGTDRPVLRDVVAQSAALPVGVSDPWFRLAA